MSKPPPPKRLRCAIYTRKSSEEGLDQSFNSLHAQRESCEAYVLSQAGEGWNALPTAYDDGGFSGGSMERPGLKKLLDDIRVGRVDIVVVYKVDRLTRSLADFAKIVEAFDAKGVSFVSVTQSFNTTTSMGRLTLNMLLSFAQFEREVTSERIRDKIAASKAKGMWMGGQLPLGYNAPTDNATRALVVNPAEAETVRLIFAKYLELGSAHELVRWLDEQGIRSKSWVTRAGRPIGGFAFGRGALFHLLKNRVYLGEIVHRDRSYPGPHPAIVDPEIFSRAQDLLSAQQRRHADSGGRVAAMPLKGLIFDTDGFAMSPTYTHGAKGRVHRYYVSTGLVRGGQRDPDDDAIRRIPARAVEELVIDVLRRLTGSNAIEISRHLVRAEVHPRNFVLTLRRTSLVRRAGDPSADVARLAERLGESEQIEVDRDDTAHVQVTIASRLKFSRGAIRFVDSAGKCGADDGLIDEALVGALRTAHGLVAQNVPERLGRCEQVVLESAPADPYERAQIRVAFLAPEIQAAILAGRQPPHLNRQRVLFEPLPLAWEDQRRAFGFERRASSAKSRQDQ
jgi:site-specific DNA recombinase